MREYANSRSPRLERYMVCLLLLFNSITITSFAQVTIIGTVRSSVDQSIVQDARVELVNIDCKGIDTIRVKINTTFTDQNGKFIFQVSTSLPNKDTEIPQEFELSNNYPNPYIDETKIDLTVVNSNNYNISIYNIIGQMVANIQKRLTPGYYSIKWNGGELPGIYFSVIQTGEETQIIKLIQLTRRKQTPLFTITSTANPVLLKQSHSNNIVDTSSLQIFVDKTNFQMYKSPILPYLNQSVNITLLYGSSTMGIVTDMDGNVYKTVKIGDQWWMAENLRVTHYQNGETIPNITNNVQWANDLLGGSCIYNNGIIYNNPPIVYLTAYGRLYNWHAVIHSGGIAPKGWHVPTDSEWKKLEINLGMNLTDLDNKNWRGGASNVGGKLKEVGTALWASPNTGANNEFGFTALPGGYRSANGDFDSFDTRTDFWSSTEYDISEAWKRHLHSQNPGISRDIGAKQNGFRIRCVKDDSPVINTAPTASFDISPPSGPTTTNFILDASSCSDLQDPIGNLQVQWDWTNDGAWDTDYTTTKSTTHQYSTAGAYTVKLRVKDTGELTNTTTKQVIVTEAGCVDIDGNVYRTIKIGDHWWMAENLKVTHFRNGDPITYSGWSTSTSSAYTNYNSDQSNVTVYGRLYNWYAAIDSRKIAPQGWHIPSYDEWQALVDYLGGYAIAGGKLKEMGNAHWSKPNVDATNTSGFTALPAGGLFSYTIQPYRGGPPSGDATYFWCSTKYGSTSNRALGWMLETGRAAISVDGYSMYYAFSIRCIKD